MTLSITNVVAVQSDNNCSHLLFVSESADGTAWLWGGHSPKPDSPYWCCSECGVSYMVGRRDALKLPTVDELPEHIRVSEQGEL